MPPTPIGDSPPLVGLPWPSLNVPSAELRTHNRRHGKPPEAPAGPAARRDGAGAAGRPCRVWRMSKLCQAAAHRVVVVVSQWHSWQRTEPARQLATAAPCMRCQQAAPSWAQELTSPRCRAPHSHDRLQRSSPPHQPPGLDGVQPAPSAATQPEEREGARLPVGRRGRAGGQGPPLLRLFQPQQDSGGGGGRNSRGSRLAAQRLLGSVQRPRLGQRLFQGLR